MLGSSLQAAVSIRGWLGTDVWQDWGGVGWGASHKEQAGVSQ